MQLSNKRSLLRGLVLKLFFIFLLPLSLSAQFMNGAEKVGDETCAECHDEVAAAFAKNIHMANPEQEGFTCESCHGPGSKHVEDGEIGSIYNPKTDFNATEKNPCISCHKDAKFESFTGSAHYELANGCSDCHTVHSKTKSMLKKQGEALCISCHQDVYAKFRLTSHHPVAEGLMTCQSCHEVHGGTVKHAFGDSKNELCVSCHSSKEGPFVFEHAPVNEDCGICHDPHGSIANNLLVQNEPALCMSCHPMHFHTGQTSFVGNFTTPLDPSRGGISTKDAIEVIYQHSKGIPRLINILCDTALVYGFADGLSSIDKNVIENVVEDRKKEGLFFEEEKKEKTSLVEKNRLSSIPEDLKMRLDSIEKRIDSLETMVKSFSEQLEFCRSLQQDLKKLFETLIKFFEKKES